ncbi:hypothetical protein [Elizabethkingia anophelis]|uniref:hypothetical protein n=1 Tax=Elizabethkingia anophelis TaxID=1117645 RepID=UPI0012B220C2|nr:hypothetical protein [Elizabethkingia anophelis]MCT4086698.1 hypothetical protein [Elizabethkingia anophelis]MCT4104476.1 hypothetical protein [Elizabethkingia anophelis]MDV4026210.1 hypothetical protein [Elizabethkingia anophelis]QGN24586.1 hypothetical protein GJV56_18685 [Elizabethkingia anophelis]QNV11228.1 hypothetical protein EIY88_18655 [Elizabethkingia anophelis]
MEWKFYPKEKPTDSTWLVVSLQKEGVHFNYIAYYDAEKDKWFRHNPFNHEENIIELDIKVGPWISIPVHI